MPRVPPPPGVRGRAPRPPDDRDPVVPPDRSTSIQADLTSAELVNLHSIARQKRMTMSDLVRWALQEQFGRLA